MRSDLEHLKATLRQLFTAFEDLAIENSVYFDAILETRAISLADLKQKVADGLADPAKRAEARQAYSEMWQAIEEIGLGAFFRDQLENLPPSDKVN